MREGCQCGGCESKLRTIRHLQDELDTRNRELRAGNEHAQLIESQHGLRIAELHRAAVASTVKIGELEAKVILRDNAIDELQRELDEAPARVGDGLTPCSVCGRRYITRGAVDEFVCDRCDSVRFSSGGPIGTYHGVPVVITDENLIDHPPLIQQINDLQRRIDDDAPDLGKIRG